jgi:RHH-type transcriptional regulator, proline utilization regulon repressor / proline dehydrogenase / delta 1-pyrroline-5-carboxylate dehydrogenase
VAKGPDHGDGKYRAAQASVLGQARAVQRSDADATGVLGSLAVELAGLLLERARALEIQEERAARNALSDLLESPDTQLFSTALTDRIHRSRSPLNAVNMLRQLSDRTGGAKSFTTLDRLQLRAARMFGPVVPKLTHKAVLGRVREEASPYLWDAEPEALRKRLSEHAARKLLVNLNYLGEEVLGYDEAQMRKSAYAGFATRSDIEALSVKLSGIEPHMDVLSLTETVQRLREQVGHIIDATQKRAGGPPLIYFDMEAYRDLSITEELVGILLSETPPNVRIGLAVQAYLPESLGLVQRLAQKSEQRVKRGGKPLRVRLVKGANLQMERVLASRHRLAVPVFSTKLEVDAHFKRVLRDLCWHAKAGGLLIGVGSHNLFDISYALLLREQHDLGAGLQIEMLEGMAGSLGAAVSELAGSILIYAPAVLEENFSSAVSYLVRRLDENTAPENFLRDAAHMERHNDYFHKQAALFQASVVESHLKASRSRRTQDRRAENSSPPPPLSLDGTFDNAADTDFTQERNRVFLLEQLAALQTDSDLHVVPLLATRGTAASRSTAAARSTASDRENTLGFDPSRPGASYTITLAHSQDIQAALTQANDYLPYWLAKPPRARAEILLQLAYLLEKNRAKLTAAMVLDGGKRVVEADVEVSEAVDFARYYAKQALELEDNLDPRGVTVVTPPWNFPLAIPLGGVLAALVAGNTVIFKPAPETPLVAYIAAKLCHRAGVPEEALSFVPCRDEDAEPLITDRRVKAVILTGATSTARLFKKLRPDLCLMAETGGKNSAYVAPVSDRQQAISDILSSAFGHAGQKCSALSLLVLHREVFEDEAFKRQLADATRSLPVGSAWDTRSFVTPLIHPPSGPLKKILAQGEEYGAWLVAPILDQENQRLISPSILWGVKPGSFPHLTEFFGPVLSVICVDDLQEAITVMNQVPYGLTAGLFSLEEQEHEEFVNQIEAGNIYINRGITGAIVGRQPFGGFKDSCFGPGAKAGGPDYVRQMTICRASALREQEVLEQREGDYERAFDEHFRGVYSGTEAYGEENFVRYLPAPTAVVLGESAEAVDIRFALKARRLCKSPYPLMILDGPGANRIAHVLGAERVDSLTLDSDGLVSRAEELGVRRLRVIGKPTTQLLGRLGNSNISALLDPVSDVGRQELLYYLRAQSISYSYHRHGNPHLAALSRLRDALGTW